MSASDTPSRYDVELSNLCAVYQLRAEQAEAEVERLRAIEAAARVFCGPVYVQGSLARLKKVLDV